MLKSLTLALVLSAGIATSGVASPIAGLLADEPLWSVYKERFVERGGRVVDNANKNISHSEGQGFSMLMAVAANDKATFDRIWTFTRENMMVRKDNLIAWKWSPRLFLKVSDTNNATDGDILVVWALLEAVEAGFGNHYREPALAILADVRKLVKFDKKFGYWMRPGAKWFSAEHNLGRDVVNLSYWVFPALERLTVLTGQGVWRKLAGSGEGLIAAASNNRAGLPPDWSALKRTRGKVEYAQKFSTEFSYNAIRVPLYLAWSEDDRRRSLIRFERNWIGADGELERVDVRRNRVKGKFVDAGYKAIAAVVNCSLNGRPFPQELRGKLDKLYYPASLHLLSIIATKQRYPQCW